MSKQYDDDLKKRIVRLRFEDGRIVKSISEEYGISRTDINTWCKTFSEECQSTPEGKREYDYMHENRQLRKQLEELEKENRFLKKAALSCNYIIDEGLALRNHHADGGYKSP